MPYIISIKDGRQTTSAHAVATLNEARDWTAGEVAAHTSDPAVAEHIVKAVDLLPEEGGTVGPLPDGTLIKVHPIAYSSLGGMVGLKAADLPTDQQILDAWNAAP